MKKQIINWLCLLAIIGLMLFATVGCSSSKNTQQSTQKDSSEELLTQVRDSARLAIQSINEKHSKELTEAKKGSVVFKDKPCPAVEIPPDCPHDSLVAIIRELEKRDREKTSKMRLLTDGSIELEGEFNEVNFELMKTERANKELSQTKIELEKSRDSLTRVINTLKESSEKTVVKKRGWQWWLLILGFILGAGSIIYLWYRIDRKK